MVLCMDSKNILKFEEISYDGSWEKSKNHLSLSKQSHAKRGFVYHLPSKKRWRTEIMLVHIFFELRNVYFPFPHIQYIVGK